MASIGPAPPGRSVGASDASSCDPALDLVHESNGNDCDSRRRICGGLGGEHAAQDVQEFVTLVLKFLDEVYDLPSLGVESHHATAGR